MTFPRRSPPTDRNLTRLAHALILLVVVAWLTIPYHNVTEPVTAPKPVPGPRDPVPSPPDLPPEPPLPEPRAPSPDPIPAP
jgi:hypothetical protein